MFANKTWARVGLVMNVLGTVLLFYSFQATSSDLRIVTTSLGDVALCFQGRALFVAQSGGQGLGIGVSNCPEWKNAKPAAVVNIEHPKLVSTGFILTFCGFIVQFLSFPSAKTEKELRAEIKRLRLQEKARSNTT